MVSGLGFREFHAEPGPQIKVSHASMTQSSTEQTPYVPSSLAASRRLTSPP